MCEVVRCMALALELHFTWGRNEGAATVGCGKKSGDRG